MRKRSVITLCLCMIVVPGMASSLSAHTDVTVEQAWDMIDSNDQLIVLDVRQGENGGELIKLINPRIMEKEGKKKSEEGCLSLPDLIVDIDRYDKVTVEALDPSGTPKRFEAEGLLSVVLQHEIDHLDGVLLVDRLSSLRRSIYHKKRLREESEPAGASNG